MSSADANSGDASSLTEEDSYELLGPLHIFYRRLHQQDAPSSRCAVNDMPEPFRSLLVHRDNMTPTLERYHGGKLRVEVLSSFRDGDMYYRLVHLVLQSDTPVASADAVVELGAIEINLAFLPEAAVALVLEGKMPFGTILRTVGLANTCVPRQMFSVTADRQLGEWLDVPEGASLFGRHNTLVLSDGRQIVDVVEVLPPQRQA